MGESVGGVGTEGSGEVAQIMYSHLSKCKNDTCRNCSRNRVRGDGIKQQRVNSNMIYLIHCKNLCKYSKVQ
jgi:hypothetical protein